MSKATQRQRAIRIVGRLSTDRHQRFDAMQLGTLLEDAQNAPPNGKSDGTIDGEFYNALRKLHNTTVAFIDACDHCERFK